MKVLVTGAGGFLGQALVQRLAQSGAEVTATDLSPPVAPQARCIGGNLADRSFVAELAAMPWDAVHHLASLPGAAAEADPEAGRRANLDAPLMLAHALAGKRDSAGRPLRLVFASSIAVYGPMTRAAVTDDTPCSPALSYGAHKRMIELLLSDMTRRGDLSAVSLRLPGIVARPAGSGGHGSAFMSDMIRAIAGGRDFSCPVPEGGRAWWLSRTAAAGLLMQAAALEKAPQSPVLAPALALTMGEMAAAAASAFGKPAKVAWGADKRLTALFASMPDIDASRAIALGLAADSDARALAGAALS